MSTLLFALTLAFAPHAQATGSQAAAVMAPINQFVDAFNKGDMKAALAACTEVTSIIDEFPPHEWHGAGACAKWMADYAADATKNGIKDGVVRLMSTRHLDVTASRAYVVLVADYLYWQNAKAIQESGSTFTFALRRTDAGWQIIGWAWAKN
jgi:hypothetical protein